MPGHSPRLKQENLQRGDTRLGTLFRFGFDFEINTADAMDEIWNPGQPASNPDTSSGLRGRDWATGPGAPAVVYRLPDRNLPGQQILIWQQCGEGGLSTPHCHVSRNGHEERKYCRPIPSILYWMVLFSLHCYHTAIPWWNQLFTQARNINIHADYRRNMERKSNILSEGQWWLRPFRGPPKQWKYNWHFNPKDMVYTRILLSVLERHKSHKHGRWCWHTELSHCNRLKALKYTSSPAASPPWFGHECILYCMTMSSPSTLPIPMGWTNSERNRVSFVCKKTLSEDIWLAANRGPQVTAGPDARRLLRWIMHACGKGRWCRSTREETCALVKKKVMLLSLLPRLTPALWGFFWMWDLVSQIAVFVLQWIRAGHLYSFRSTSLI